MSTLLRKINQTALKKLGNQLYRHGLQVVLAESMTAGSMATIFSLEERAGDYFLGSIVCYHDEMKCASLDIDRNLLAQHGAVSSEVTAGMIEGLMQKYPFADVYIANTGFAYDCDEASEDKPVGTVYVHIRVDEHHHTNEFHFQGNAEEIMSQAIDQTIARLSSMLSNLFNK